MKMFSPRLLNKTQLHVYNCKYDYMLWPPHFLFPYSIYEEEAILWNEILKRNENKGNVIREQGEGKIWGIM